MSGSLHELRPGDIMFARKLRPASANALVHVGQLALGQPGWPRHVGVITEAGRTEGPSREWPTGVILAPKMVQAMPGGAEEIDLTYGHWTPDYVYIRPLYKSEYTAPAVARAARRYIGTPYSFLDYASIAAHRMDPVWRSAPHACASQRLAQYVRDSGHMICSQLADQSLADAGWHVFDDGRLPQDVTPAGLYVKMLSMPTEVIFRPGQ